jgi:type II secretory pathway pseudopilin PulG
MCSTERRNGFVLLEAVIALAIIALFAIALLSALGAQVRAADRGSVLLVQRALAEDRLMALQLLDYDGLAGLPDSLQQGRFAEPFEEFTWTASALPLDQEYDLFSANITVEGRGYSFPLQSLLHRPRAVAQEGSL